MRPAAKVVYNSAFPLGYGPGPTWNGRGLTAELSGGFTARYRRLRLQIAPVAFLAQNEPFALAFNGGTGDALFRDARFPGSIDAPQRFGPSTYGRVDPGNSSVSLDLPGTVVGVSTVAQSWGPAREFPIVLSGNSGGFPHAFVATRSPIPLWLFGVHARVIAGTLAQSRYSPVQGDSVGRWATGMAVVLMPRGLRGLEIGVTRFIAGRSAGRFPTAKQLGRIFGGGLSGTGELNLPAEDQVGSAFFRWAFAEAGVEVYGEYAREDYSLELRRLLQYPDDYRAYLFGLQRVVQHSEGYLRVFKFELTNAEPSPSNRGERGLVQSLPFYIHSGVNQGLSNNGLLLGSPEVFGGAAWRIGMDQFDARGRLSVSLERRLRLDWSAAARPAVLWGMRAEVMRFAGAREFTVSVAPMLDLNHNLKPGHDVFNLNLAVAVRGLR